MSRIAVLQMTSGIDPLVNAQALVGAIGAAAMGGAEMLFTPEMSGLIDRDRARATANIVPEEQSPVLAAVREAAAAADVVITSGGVSVGEADFVKGLMAQLGEVLFWKIAMKPGRPMAFGRIGDRAHSAWLFGLPGNPVAVMVTFYQFVRDALYVLMGADPLPVVPLLPAVCTAAIRKAPGRTEFQRGILSQVDGRWCVRPTGAQGSGVLRSMSDANCFVVLEHDRGQVAVGDQVQVQLFDGLV